MSDKFTKLREFLREMDCAIRAEVTSDGCIVYYPRLLFAEEIPEKIHEYHISGSTLNGVKHIKYAIRPIIITELFINATIHNYDLQLISFIYNGEEINEDEFMLHVPISLTNKQLQQEETLVKLITGAISYRFSDDFSELARKHGVYSGFNTIKSLMSKYYEC